MAWAAITSSAVMVMSAKAMVAVFHQVLARLPDVALAGEPVRLTSNFQNGLKHLPVRWTAS